MKRFVIALVPLVLTLLVGCHNQSMHRRGGGCPQCQHAGGGRIADGLMAGHYARGMNQEGAEDPGPAAAAVAYPYYTLRGPRDFLTTHPPSIGR